MTSTRREHDSEITVDGQQMPDLNPPLKMDLQGQWWRVVLALAAAILFGLGSLQLLNILAGPLGILILGITIAAALAPAVKWLSRWLPRLVAIIFVYLFVAIVLLGTIGLIIPSLVQQLQAFTEQIPSITDRIEQLALRWSPVSLDMLTDQLVTQIGEFTSSLVSLPLSIANVLFLVFLVIFISIYGLILTPQAEGFILSLVPRSRRERIDELLSSMAAQMGGYVRGTLLSGAIIAALTYPGLLLIGMNFALVLSVFSGLMEIVPVVGPVISGVFIIAVALLQGTNQALLALAVVIIIQQIENHIIIPNVMRSQTSISPLLVILALYAGNEAGGIIGALAAIPFTAALREFTLQVIAPAIRRWTGAAVTG